MRTHRNACLWNLWVAQAAVVILLVLGVPVPSWAQSRFLQKGQGGNPTAPAPSTSSQPSGQPNWWQFVQPFIPQPQQPGYRPPQQTYRPVPQQTYRPQPYPVNRPTLPNFVPSQSLSPPPNIIKSPTVQPQTIQPPANILALKKTPPKNNLALLLPKSKESQDYPMRAKLARDKEEGERSTYAYQSPASQEQSKILNELLKILEGSVRATRPAGVNQQDFENAMQEAQKGNLDPHTKLLDDYKKQPGSDPKWIELVEDDMRAQALAQQAAAGKPLDEKKLDALAMSFTLLGSGQELKNWVAQLQVLNKLIPPTPPVGPGPGGPWPGPPGFLPGAIYGPPVVDLTIPMPRGDIVLVNRLENGALVRYAISNRQYELDSGRMHAFGVPSQGYWTITFDRGGSYGTARYSLTVGAYEFVLTATGWDLRKKQYIFTLDNSQLAGAFNCLLDGKETIVPAGESVTLTSPYPMEIVFDRGDGSEPARKLLDNGVYKVGIDPTRQRLELFPASSASVSPPLSAPTAAVGPG